MLPFTDGKTEAQSLRNVCKIRQPASRAAGTGAEAGLSLEHFLFPMGLPLRGGGELAALRAPGPQDGPCHQM